jgi:4-hydroxybenzoate polyprenyltransferase and related prenyltransferases
MAGRSHTIPLLYRLARPKNAVPPLLAVLLGYTAAGGQTFSETTLLTSLFGVLCLNFAATLQNDLADKTIDASAKRRTPLLDGQVANEQVHLVGVGLSMLSLAVPALFGQTVVFVSLLVYLILCWFYNQPPIQASRRPISSIALLAFVVSHTAAPAGRIRSRRGRVIMLYWPHWLLVDLCNVLRSQYSRITKITKQTGSTTNAHS